MTDAANSTAGNPAQTGSPQRSTDQDLLDAEELASVIDEGEEWLMERILHYASLHDYTQYTSTLICAWRLSISGLSEAITAAVREAGTAVTEFDADVDLASNPVAQFAIAEALEHRKRGINLGMFLSLLKYYRQAYIDLVEARFGHRASIAHHRLAIYRLFDLFEIGLTTEWNSTPADEVINELKAANRAITNEKNFYLTAYESFSDPAFLLDEDNRILALNKAANSFLTGHFTAAGKSYYQTPTTSLETASETELTGELIVDVVPELRHVLLTQHIESQAVHTEYTLNANDQTFEFLISQSPMQDVSGKYSGSVVFLTDISDRVAMEKQLREMTERDPLTGASNRRHLVQIAETEIARALRHGWPISGIAIDIDHFKAVNDSFGHAMGDDVLIEVASICQASTRPEDSFARIGGEEFFLFLPHTEKEQARELAERLRENIAAQSPTSKKLDLGLTASFGVAQLNADDATLSALMLASDNALYKAKETGRNRVVVAGDG